jgi:DNA-binding Lrp family transcriptional regulator
MIEAYVLIQTHAGTAAHVAAAISAIPGVLRAEAVAGPYDVIAQAESPAIDDLGRLVAARIQQVEDIYGTLTCPVVELRLAAVQEARSLSTLISMGAKSMPRISGSNVETMPAGQLPA